MKAFIIFRDRVTYGIRCMDALVLAGLDVIVADHGSTWPAAVSWLDALQNHGTEVIRCGPGHHPRDLWSNEEFRKLCGDDRYIVTDPDVVPAEGCPLDWPKRLSELLDTYRGYQKVGLGLRIDCIPEHYKWHAKVLSWETQYWLHEVEPRVYSAGVDTTLALHQPLSIHPGHSIGGALRTGVPYVADHLAWYENLSDLSPELQHYHQHAELGITFWNPDAPLVP